MAHHQTHFQHHHLEVKRTRRRYLGLLTVLLALLCVAAGLQIRDIRAATTETVSGRVYNQATGAGLSNVRVNICNFGVAITSSAGTYSFGGLPQGSEYCARYLGGAPVGVTGPLATAANPDVGAVSAYENQVARFNCYHVLTCSAAQRLWDRAGDSGLDFAFSGTSVVAARVNASSAANPTAKPVDTLVAGTSGSASASGGAAPNAPGNFQATVAGENAVVSLSWDAATSDIGIKGYKIERSLDQTNWTWIGGNVADTSYDDASVAFGIHYYYRLSAIDQAGHASGFAMSDATTGSFNSNTAQDVESSFTSDDSLATAKVPPNTVASDAVCSVSRINLPKDGKKPGTTQQPLVLGPYQMLCKTLGGDTIKLFANPVAWSLNLQGKLKGLTAPKAYTLDSDGNKALISTSKFDDSGSSLTFATASTDQVVALADVQQGVSPNWIIAIILVVGIMLGLVVLISRKQQKHTYDEYLRSKYYNL